MRVTIHFKPQTIKVHPAVEADVKALLAKPKLTRDDREALGEMLGDTIEHGAYEAPDFDVVVYGKKTTKL